MFMCDQQNSVGEGVDGGTVNVVVAVAVVVVWLVVVRVLLVDVCVNVLVRVALVVVTELVVDMLDVLVIELVVGVVDVLVTELLDVAVVDVMVSVDMEGNVMTGNGVGATGGVARRAGGGAIVANSGMRSTGLACTGAGIASFGAIRGRSRGAMWRFSETFFAVLRLACPSPATVAYVSECPSTFGASGRHVPS